MAYRQAGIFILAEAEPPLVFKKRVPERQSLSAQHGGGAAKKR
jgi:hypothetical protein